MASLGLENNKIPDTSITASSHRASHRASLGRLYQHGRWASYIHSTEQWFQVELLNWTKVTGVAIQGFGRGQKWWVTKFKLAYSNDGMFFSDYSEDSDNAKVLF